MNLNSLEAGQTARNHGPSQLAILAVIREFGPITRDDISERSNILARSVCGRVSELLENNDICHAGDCRKTGRKRELLRLV